MRITKYLKICLAAIVLSISPAASAEPAAAPDLSDILGGLGGALGSVVEGVFTKSDLTIADIAGEWTSNGSAVSFKSDNFLKKAGGIAAAGAVESKLDKYYKQYGLTGAVLQIDKDGNFILTIKRLPIRGTLSVKSEGVFTFTFTAFGTTSLGSMDAYVEKSPSGLNVMFDADKIKKIISFAATLSRSKMAGAADKILQEYDGICIGFKMTGKAASAAENDSTRNQTDAAINALRGLFGR